VEPSFSKRVKWRVETAAYAVVGAALRQLPVGTAFVLGEILGKMIWPLMKDRQRIIMRNLRIAGAGRPEEIAGLARESFVRTTANLVVSTASSNATAGRLGEMLTVENPELIEEAVSKGKGTVLLLSHMGNWELLTRFHRTFPEGTKSGAFYRPLNNPVMNGRVLKEREADGTRLFSKRDSLHLVSGFLRENGVIGILADQRVGLQGEVVPFFGRLTRASPLPSLLVRRCKSEVLALSLKTVAPGKWRARYHRVENPYDSANCMEALERAMKVSLLDVFWLQERWRVYVGRNVSARQWLGKPDGRGAKPHRALVWTKESEEEEQLPPEWTHVDIEYERAFCRDADELEAIDLSKKFPLDFIVAFSRDEAMRVKAKKLGIPFVVIGDC